MPALSYKGIEQYFVRWPDVGQNLRLTISKARPRKEKMSYHEMACDAGYGPNDSGHAEMEAMAEAQHRHEFEMQCAGEAAEQAQAEAAQAEEEQAQTVGQQP